MGSFGGGVTYMGAWGGWHLYGVPSWGAPMLGSLEEGVTCVVSFFWGSVTCIGSLGGGAPVLACLGWGRGVVATWLRMGSTHSWVPWRGGQDRPIPGLGRPCQGPLGGNGGFWVHPCLPLSGGPRDPGTSGVLLEGPLPPTASVLGCPPPPAPTSVCVPPQNSVLSTSTTRSRNSPLLDRGSLGQGSLHNGKERCDPPLRDPQTPPGAP